MKTCKHVSDAAGSATHDLITTVPGLVTAVIAALAIQAGGLCHLATVCTSFVFINSGTHGRCMAIPEGWREYSPEYMQIGTCLAARSAILALIAWCMGAIWVLEQPSSSCMLYLTSWQVIIRWFSEKVSQGLCNATVLRNSVFMVSFRGPTLKPTSLFSNESLEMLMNVPVPPKELRPPAAPVAHVFIGKHMDGFVDLILFSFFI